jgi:hypothetical protein
MRSTDQNGAGTSGEFEQTPGARAQKSGLGAIHWNAILALITIGVLYALLPSKVSIGPSWLLVAVEGVFVFLLVMATLTRGRVSPVTNRIGSLILLLLVTLSLTVGVGHLISTLKSSNVIGIDLIRSGLLLYCFNILVSALWYWEIDGGGPEKRRLSEHLAVDFLFPQQMGGYVGNWSPHFFDYLYLAFTAAAAFSPTDTLPLSRRAKFIMMVEAVLALVIISFVVSRAINII